MKKLITLGVMALAFAACSPGDLADNILEEAIESQDGAGDVDVDIDSDDGTVEITGEDGETATFGGGEVPDDMPFPVPEGGDVQTVFTSNEGNSVSILYPEEAFESFVELYQGIFDSESAGDDNAFSQTSANSASFAWNTSDDELRSVTISKVPGQTIISFLYGDS